MSRTEGLKETATKETEAAQPHCEFRAWYPPLGLIDEVALISDLEIWPIQ